MAADKMAKKASKAMWALCAKLDGLSVRCMEVKLHLFEMLVMSIGNYGCQIWGVDYLRVDSEAHVFNNPLQKLLFVFLRSITGAHRSTSRWTLLNEFGLRPVQVKWAKLCARWWNNCVGGINGQLMQRIMKQDIGLFQKGHDKCWVAKFLTCMGRLNLLGGKSVGQTRASPIEEVLALKFSESAVEEAFRNHYETHFLKATELDPRNAPSIGLAQVKHTQWFANEAFVHLKF